MWPFEEECSGRKFPGRKDAEGRCRLSGDVVRIIRKNRVDQSKESNSRDRSFDTTLPSQVEQLRR